MTEGYTRTEEQATVNDEPSANGHYAGATMFRNTDQGNAERLVALHGQDFHYIYPWGTFAVWSGERWNLDNTGAIVRLAKNTARAMFHEADCGDGHIDKDLAKHALNSQSRSRIEAMIALAQSEPGVPLLPDQFDNDPWLLNCANGTVDLRTGELRKHRREDLLTKIAPVEYDPDAEAPVWESFLHRILPSEALRRFVQRVLGYAAAAVVSEEILVILYGYGANGKSTLVNAVMEALGDYAMQAAPDLLLAKRGSHPTELADLFGARFVASVEVDEGRRLAESLVKQLTGRDRIRARRMREDFWEFDPTHTVFLATNHRPEVRGTDLAIWRRIKLVPFEVTIPDDEQDKKLPQKLRAELPGILAWIVRGCVEWQREGLGAPEEVTAATEGYRAEMDVLAAFIEDRCVVGPKYKANATDLYHAYQEWCDENGEKWEKQTKFGLRLGERGFRREKAQRVTWYGIGLRDDRPDPDRTRGSDDDRLNDESPIDKASASNQDRRLDSPRPENDMNTRDSSREGVNPENGLQPSNRLQPSNAGDAMPRGERLTADEVQRYRQHVHEGMKPEFARAEILKRRGKA